MTPRFVGEAVADLIDLEDFFEATWPGSRARLAADLDDFLVRVSTHPLVFARTTGSVRGRNVREGLLDAFPVRVAYEVTPTEIVVLSLQHARSRVRHWRRRLPPTR